MEEVNGQCSCGAVVYKFSAETLIAYQCHCSICRKATGSAFTTSLITQENRFTWLHGAEAISSYVKENGYTVSFCSHCGSPVPNKLRDYPLLCVPVGGIEGSPHVKVAAQLYLGSRAEWDKNTFGGRKFHEMPSLDELFEFLRIHEHANNRVKSEAITLHCASLDACNCLKR